MVFRRICRRGDHLGDHRRHRLLADQPGKPAIQADWRYFLSTGSCPAVEVTVSSGGYRVGSPSLRSLSGCESH